MATAGPPCDRSAVPEAPRRSARSRPRSANWGGARPGAGRPPRGPTSSEPHKRRPRIAGNQPVHITARVLPAVGSLRRARARAAIRRALTTSLARTDFRIVELELRAHQLELVVEADHHRALARGMQGFLIAAARYLNRSAGRRGEVFPDRYRARVLATRRAVRAAIAALPARERVCAPVSWLLRVEAQPPALARRRHRPRRPDP